MESPFYGYYHFSTDSVNDAWNTGEIEAFLSGKNCFITNGKGEYKHNAHFFSLNLMLVSDFDSWNSDLYDSGKTNYIDIVTSKKIPAFAEQFFRDFGAFLGRNVVEEKDEDL